MLPALLHNVHRSILHKPSDRPSAQKTNFAPESSYAFSRTAPRKSGPWRGSVQWAICDDHEVSVTIRSMPDQLSTLYSDLLEGSYDCVDRIVLNAYFGMGQTGGGLRVWWRELYGSDADLDDNHL